MAEAKRHTTKVLLQVGLDLVIFGSSNMASFVQAGQISLNILSYLEKHKYTYRFFSVSFPYILWTWRKFYGQICWL